MKKSVLMIAPVVILAVVTGCRKEPIRNLSRAESRIYVTHSDSTVNFSNYQTFSFADSVNVIEDNQLVERALTDADAAVLHAVAVKLQALGYTQVEYSAQPDLGVNVSRIYSNTKVVTYPDYWGDYYGYWDPGYWGYGGYAYTFPGYYGVYQIQEGGLSVDLLDLKNAAQNKAIKGIWNGLVRGTGVFDIENAESEVEALFKQSAYITTNQ